MVPDLCVVLHSPSPLLGGAVLGDAAVPSISGLVLLSPLGWCCLLFPFFWVLLRLPLLHWRGGVLHLSHFWGGTAFHFIPREVVPFSFLWKEMKLMFLNSNKIF